MSPHLLIETTGHVAVLVAAFAVATGMKALASVLRTWIEQRSRTRRLDKALEDSRPGQRAEIIMACSQFELRSAGRAGWVLPVQGRPRPPVLILQNKRGHEERGD